MDDTELSPATAPASDAPALGYVRSDRAWYAFASNIREPDISFGLYDSQLCGPGEARMVWERLDGQLIAHLMLFPDSWYLFTLCRDLFGYLSSGDLSPDAFEALLRQHGFTDRTPYRRAEAAQCQS